MKRSALTRACPVLFIGLFFAIVWSEDACSQEVEAPLIGHAYYGQMVIENDDPNVDGGSYDINLFGVDVQKRLRSGLLSYGYETGALLSVETEDRRARAAAGGGGGSLAVAVSFNFVLVDYFVGGFVGIAPADWLRLYAGAGPLLIWGSRETEREASADDDDATQSESELGAGVYVRAGLDILFTDIFGISAGVRFSETSLSFEETVGQVDVAGWQYYGGISFKF